MKIEWSNKDSLEIPETTAGYGSVSWSDYKTGTSCDSVKLPTVDAEPVRHGHWVRNDNGTYSCSECHSWIPSEQYHYARYCLFCGAKMNEEEESETNR